MANPAPKPADGKHGELSSEDFFFSFLPEYLDSELSTEAQARFEAMLKEPTYEKIPGTFRLRVGRLQLGLQRHILGEDVLAHLRGLVRDPVVLATQEAVRIEAMGRGELMNTLLRRIVVVLICGLIIGYGIWKFGGGAESKFKALEYLGYESQTLNAGKTEKVLNLPTSELADVVDYFKSYPDLGYMPKTFKGVPAPWQLDGATVIDYEIAKVAVVQYTNPESKEKLFHFTYAGRLSELPSAEQGNMLGLVYQTYTSGDLNFIAWEPSSQTVSMLVGHRSAPELAQLAVSGSGK